MKRRITIAAVLIAAMLCTILAGCGESASSAQSAASSTKAESTKAESTKAESTKAESTKAESTKAESTASSSTAPGGAVSDSPLAGLTFEYFNLSMGVEWIQQMDDRFQKKAAEYGFTYYNADADYRIENMLAQIDTALTAGIDGAFIFICEEASATAVCDKFAEANVPVIGESILLQDGNGHNVAPYVELDAVGVGEKCAEWVAENYATCGANITDLSKVGVILNTTTTFQSNVNRTNGFANKLKELLPDIPEENYLIADDSSSSSDDDAENSYNILSALISGNPQYTNWIVIAAADNFAMGCARALENSGVAEDSILVSCGGEYAVKEWDVDAAECWRAACYFDASTYVDLMIEGMLQYFGEGKALTEILPEYKQEGQDYANVGITGTMVTRDNYKEYVEGYK